MKNSISKSRFIALAKSFEKFSQRTEQEQIQVIINFFDEESLTTSSQDSHEKRNQSN